MSATQIDDAKGVATGPDTVRFERLVPGPIERAWSWLVEADKRGRWLASGEMAPRVGAEFTLSFRHNSLTKVPGAPPDAFKAIAESGHVSQHRVTRFEPPHALAFTWAGGSDGGESEVSFELASEGDLVRLVLTHRRLGDRATMAGVAGGWQVHLKVLTEKLNGREPAPFWDLFREGSALYADGL
jgi:uncharacterized protein YndB with AHSA1/START domain